jgi:uncharacterized protein YgbK (DUF1537 family)
MYTQEDVNRMLAEYHTALLGEAVTRHEYANALSAAYLEGKIDGKNDAIRAAQETAVVGALKHSLELAEVSRKVAEMQASLAKALLYSAREVCPGVQQECGAESSSIDNDMADLAKRILADNLEEITKIYISEAMGWGWNRVNRVWKEMERGGFIYHLDGKSARIHPPTARSASLNQPDV